MGVAEYRPGLEGVIATETAISYLDVEHEEIVVRGYNLLDLARQRTYVDVVGLLVNGHLPDAAERAELERQLLAVASRYAGGSCGCCRARWTRWIACGRRSRRSVAGTRRPTRLTPSKTGRAASG